MDHASNTPITEHPNRREKTTATTLQTIGRLRNDYAQHLGRITGKKGQTQVSTCATPAVGFLKTAFLPRWKEDKTAQATAIDGKMERDFFKSLSKVAEHYAIEMVDVDHYGYPHNMALALWDVQNKLKSTVNNWDSLRFVKEDKKYYFITEETYDTSTTLYYIPMVPLFYMLKNPKSRKSAVLLLSVCSYLYLIADIPYYRQQNSYLFWQYEMLTDWVEQDEDEQETSPYMRELEFAIWVGDFMEQKIANKKNLQVFEQRLKSYKCTDRHDFECKAIAESTIHLIANYPNENIFRNAKRWSYDRHEDYHIDQEMVTMEKYISFSADCDGWLNETLLEVTNNELNEYGEIEEPYLLKKFDGREINSKTLDFENRVFDVIERLCTLLTNYKENHNE